MTQQILASTQVGCALPYSICDERTTALVPDFDFSAGNSNGVFTHGRPPPIKVYPRQLSVHMFNDRPKNFKTLFSYALIPPLMQFPCNLHPSPPQRKLRFTFLTLASPPPSHTIVPSLPAHLLPYASNSANPVLSTPPMQNVDQPKDKSPDHHGNAMLPRSSSLKANWPTHCTTENHFT
jgi:hypothetical protein